MSLDEGDLVTVRSKSEMRGMAEYKQYSSQLCEILRIDTNSCRLSCNPKLSFYRWMLEPVEL